MRITVRGWGRDVGETLVMSGSLGSAETPGDTFSRDKLYKKIFSADDRRRTKVRVSTSTELRLGGTYLLHVELTRAEIAQLFYETHSGSMVRMLQSFIDGENEEDRQQTEAERQRMHARFLEMKAE